MPQLISIVKAKLKTLWSKGAFHIFIGSFLTKFVAFFGSIFLVRVLSKTSYGILGYVENIYSYVHILAGMGLGNAILRYVVLGETKEEKYGYYKYAITRGTIYNLIIIITVAILGMFYPHPKEFEGARFLLIIILFALPFQFLMESNQLSLRAMFDNKKYATYAFLATTTLIISRYLSALFFDLKGVILSKVIIYIFFALMFMVSMHKTYFKGTKTTTLTKEVKKEVNIYSIQYMVTNGLWTIFMLNDTFLLGQLSGDPTILADYKVAYVLPGNLSIVSASIGIFVVPYFIAHESDLKWVKANYKKVFGLTAGLMAIAVAILFIFAKPVINLLYGPQYENVISVMRLLLIASFCNNGLRFTTANLLSAMGQVKYNMRVSFLGVITQVLLNVLVIPQYGALGVAFTSIIVYLMMAIILFIVFAKKYKLFMKSL